MYNELEFIVSALVGFTGVSFCFFPKHLSNRSLNKLLCVLMILSYLVSSISKPKKVPDELCTQIIQTGVNISAIFYLMGLWTAYKYAETIIVGDIYELCRPILSIPIRAVTQERNRWFFEKSFHRRFIFQLSFQTVWKINRRKIKRLYRLAYVCTCMASIYQNIREGWMSGDGWDSA